MLSDALLFPVAQAALLALAVIAILIDLRTGQHRGEAFAKITRGHQSMAIFYGAYGGATTIFVGLSLSVDFVSSYRTFFVVFDVVAIFYLCLLNSWFRNKLIGWTSKLPSAESR